MYRKIWCFKDQREFSQKFPSSTLSVIFLSFVFIFVSIFGDGNCRMETPSCPSETHQSNTRKELPRLKLWRKNETSRILDQPAEATIHVTAFPPRVNGAREVIITEVEISCTAPYPVLLVTLMASDSEEEFLMSSMTNPFEDIFLIHPPPEGIPVPGFDNSGEINVDGSPSWTTNQSLFEIRINISLALSLERNVSVFACEAVDNPCLGSVGKLVFTNRQKSFFTNFYSKEVPIFDFSVRMVENLQPHPHPFLTSSHRSLPIKTTSTNTSNNGHNHRNSTGHSSEPQLECDALFYYQLVPTEIPSYNEASFHLAYSCEFSDGSPGLVKINVCGERGRCDFPRSKKQTVKNCWRGLLPGETCKNCTKMETGFGFVSVMEPFVPFCVSRKTTPVSIPMPRPTDATKEDLQSDVLYIKKEDMVDGIRVVKGTPLYVGFPSSFNISRPRIHAWDNDDQEELDGSEGMIRMAVFEEIQLVNSVLEITCQSAAHYTYKAFKYALKFQNRTKLQFLTSTNDTHVIRTVSLMIIGQIHTQTVRIHLNESQVELLLEVERIFCFAPVQNSFKSINFSRPLRIVPHVRDLFKRSRCGTGARTSDAGLEPHPELVVLNHYVGVPALYLDPRIDVEVPFDVKQSDVHCRANYPIELIHTVSYEKGEVGENAKYSSHRLVERGGKIVADVVYSFDTNSFKIKEENESHFFRCQSIENPCLHRSFQYIVEGNKSPMVRSFTPDGENQSIQSELGRPPDYRECEALFFYKEIPDYLGYEFGCELAFGERGVVDFHFCDTMNDCANTFRNQRQSPECWRKVKSWNRCSWGLACGTKKATGLRPFVATCSIERRYVFVPDPFNIHTTSKLGSFAVFGLPTTLEGIPPIYLSEEEIEPENMTYLEPFDPYQFPGTNLTLTCRVSAFFNNYIKIAKYFSNRDELKFIPDSEQYNPILDEDRHFQSFTTTIDLGKDPDLSHIYCIGLYWKGSNFSREIHLHAPEAPGIALHVNDFKGERVVVERGAKVSSGQLERTEFFPLSSANVSILCHGFGYPPPEISWTTNAANEPKNLSTVLNATHSLSKMILPVMDVGVQGTYICTAKSKQGKVTSSVRLAIKYPVSASVVIISSVGSFLVLILIMALFLFVRRVRKLKRILRDLSDEEVNQFHFGDKTVDPSDKNAEIYALAYDRSLEVSPDSIEIDEDSLALGAGEFGIVRSGFLKTNMIENECENDGEVQTRVAIKMPKFNVTTENFKSFLYEIKIMSFVQNHENVVKILAASTLTIKKRRALIALEFCELGNLKNFLRDKKLAFKNEFQRASLTECEQMDFSEATGGYDDSWDLLNESVKLETLDLFNFSLGIANGMNFLAEKKVIHGDLAARNVLLTRNREVKISDFGFSTQLKNYETYTKTNSLTIPWRWFPIEALVDRKFTLKSDCWSYGILLYEIFSLGADPYPGIEKLDLEFVQKLREGCRNEMPEFANEDVYDLMTECWQNDPNERPTFAVICDKILEMSREIAVPKLNLI